jgi:lysine N6-hydroxylase
MSTTNELPVYDMLGVGIGPSNLSTAALLAPYNKQVRSIFFDDKPEFNWYPGMLFPDATIQVSILKDLVTMVDPTSPFTFLNFLKETGRLYMFASKGQFDGLKRREFVQYFKWAVAGMKNLYFSSTVQQIEYKNNCFEVRVNDITYIAKNLAMGAGLSANIPSFCRKYIGSNVVHSSQFLTSNINFHNKKVMVVGGGQSGAEVVLFLLKDEERLPKFVQWVSSNYNFLPMENTPFSNELYTPKYSDYFYNLHKEDKERLLERQKFTSDGVSEKTLCDIYETLYNYKFLRDIDILDFYPGTYFTNLEHMGNNFRAELTLKEKNSATQYMEVDIIVLATGFNYQRHKCLEPLDGYISTTDGKYDVAEDFSIVAKQQMKGKIYLHNGARHVRGVADPNLSLLAWRSAKIINALMERQVYNTEIDKSLLNWDKLMMMKGAYRAIAV